MNNLHKINEALAIPAKYRAFADSFKDSATYKWDTQKRLLLVNDNSWIDRNRWEICAMDSILESVYYKEHIYIQNPTLIPSNLQIV